MSLRMTRAAAAVLVATMATACLSGCSGRRGRGERPAITRDAGGLPRSDGGPRADGGDDGTRDGGPPPREIRGCFRACEVVEDCVSTSAISDADNYRCTGGVCEYLGCNSDAECTETFADDFRCLPGTEGIPGCFRACEVVEDCTSTSPISDADNYQCTDGICEYLGCNSDAECTDTFEDDYRCLTNGGSIPGCYRACDVVADCTSTSPISDADNYQCSSEGLCEYLGCNSDMECTDTFEGAYVCRAP